MCIRDSAKAAHTQTDAQREAERVRAEKAEHDRALEAERKAQARTRELHAQARQIIEDKQVAQAGEQDYRFEANGAIRSVRVDDAPVSYTHLDVYKRQIFNPSA